MSTEERTMQDEIEDSISGGAEESPTTSPSEEAPEPAVETPPSTAPPESTSDPDTEYAKRFVGWLRDNPDKAQQLVEWERGKLTFTPAEEIQRNVDDILDDPDVKVREHDERLRTMESRVSEWQNQQNLVILDDGISRFRTANPNLSDEDYKAVEAVAARLQLVAAHMPRTRDALSPIPPQQAVADALEDARRIAFHDRDRQMAASQVAKDHQQKKRAAAASTPRSRTERSSPVPETKEERFDAMVAEIAENLT